MISFPQLSAQISKNGTNVQATASFEHGDQLNISRQIAPLVKDFAELQHISLIESISVFFKGERVLLTRENVILLRNGKELEETTTINNGDSLQTLNKNADPFIFQDIFRFIDLTIPTTGVKGFKILRNETEVGFNEPLAPGDQLDVVF
jgi:hypothetical protein